MKTNRQEYGFSRLMKKADDGDLGAMREFVRLSHLRDDEETDAGREEKCREYIKILVTAKDPIGYLWMADSFLEKETGYKDADEAIRYYETAAENGIGFSYECIGEIYYHGMGVPQDYGKAYQYFQKTEEPSFMALYYLGEMYRNGFYLDKNEEMAGQYYQRIVDEAADAADAQRDLFYRFAKERLNGNLEEFSRQ